MSDQDIAAKIRKQVTFYLGDSNLPYDKYLWNLHQANDGWIPIKTIADFKKMKMITTDFDTVVKALKDEPSDLYEVNDEQKIKRKTEVVKQDHTSRTLYAKPFAIEKPSDDSVADLLNLQDEIQEFFEQHGTVLCVRMRKTEDRDPKSRKFKGSVFVEFSSPEEAKKVADMDLEYKGNKLEMKTKSAYIEEKKDKYKEQPKKPGKKSFNAFAAEATGKNKRQRTKE